MDRRLEADEQRRGPSGRRLERAAAVAQVERRARVRSGFKMVAMGLATILVVAGGVWAVGKLASLAPGECNFHEHASFRVAERGEIPSFQHGEFDMKAGMPMRAHLHQPNDYQLHLEGGCASVKTVFSYLKMDIRPDYLKLDDALHGGRILQNEGNDTIQFYLYQPGAGNGSWGPFPELLGHQLRDGQRMLVAFGNYTAPEIASLQSRVTAPGE